MPVRVRRRSGLGARWSLDLDTLNAAGTGDLPAEAWEALRDRLLGTFAARLELLEAFWRHEPDVPTWLRSLPEGADAALVAAVADPSPAAWRAYETADTARTAVLVGRRAYLRGHGPAEPPDAA